jgi:hypothetical protein
MIKNSFYFSPAMCDNWSRVDGIQCFHPLEEHQKWGGMNWHSVVGPCRELAMLNVPGQFIPPSSVFQPQCSKAIMGQFRGLNQGNLNIQFGRSSTTYTHKLPYNSQRGMCPELANIGHILSASAPPAALASQLSGNAPPRPCAKSRQMSLAKGPGWRCRPLESRIWAISKIKPREFIKKSMGETLVDLADDPE